jgi:transketolase N-terminal domain/subunit
MTQRHKLEELTKYIRYPILVSTTRAGSGHPTSAMSSTDLMTAMMFGGTFRFDVHRPENPNNDRLVFSFDWQHCLCIGGQKKAMYHKRSQGDPYTKGSPCVDK